MTRRLLLALILVSTSYADEAFERALEGLRSDDPAARDAAELEILGQGTAVLQDCRRALRTETDLEALVRLARLCDLLDFESRLRRLSEVWSDQWFRVQAVDREGTPTGRVGWGRTSIVPAEHEGRAVFRVTQEFEIPDEDDPRDAWFRLCTGLLNPDWTLSPVELSVQEGRRHAHEVEEETTTHLKFNGSGLDMQESSTPADNPGFGIGIRFEGGRTPRAVAALALLPCVVERAALQRLESIDDCLLSVGRLNTESRSIRFEGASSLEWAGQSVAVRHYTASKAEDDTNSPWEFWVSDDDGLVKAVFAGIVITRAARTDVQPGRICHADRRALRETHDALWNALLTGDWEEVRRHVGQVEWDEIVESQERWRDTALQEGGRRLRWLERDSGTSAARARALSAPSFAARTHFAAIPRAGHEARVVGVTVDVNEGEVELVLPSRNELRSLCYEWDGAKWNFCGLMFPDRERPSRGSPRDLMVYWQDHAFAYTPERFWHLCTPRLVNDWVTSCADELEQARTSGEGSLRPLAARLKVSVSALRRMSAFEFTRKSYAAFVSGICAEAAKPERAHASIVWKGDGSSPWLARVKCTEGCLQGMTWVWRKQRGGGWLIDSDPMLAEFLARTGK